MKKVSYLILASSSKARKKLLSLLKVPFTVVPSKIDETKIFAKTPLETIKLRAKVKGENVAKQLSMPSHHSRSPRAKLVATIGGGTTALILSADSMALLNGKLIGKPKDKNEAREVFQLLSGKTHEFITAIYAIRISKIKNPHFPKATRGKQKSKVQLKIIKTWQEYERTLVTFKKLTDYDINLYLKITDPTVYAAGYALSTLSQTFIAKIKGSLSNVIGLPLEKVIPILIRSGFVLAAMNRFVNRKPIPFRIVR